jgi:hypothetical protein
LFQNIFFADHILRSEQPEELWCCVNINWKYTILNPQTVPLTKNFDYDGSPGVEAFLRVAKFRGVKVRFFDPTVPERCRYYFTRKLRPNLVKIFRQFQLAKKKIFKPRRSSFRSQNNSSVIYAFIRSPVHLARILPVLEELLKESWQPCIISDLSLAVHQKCDLSSRFPVIELSTYQNLNLYKYRNVAKKIKDKLLKIDDFPQLFYQNILVTDIICEVMRQIVDRLDESASILKAFEHIIKINKPSIVVLGNDQEVSARCLVNLCRQNNIPTITVQHGLMTMPPLHFVPVVSDKIAVMGKMSFDLLKKFSVSPERIQPTGIPGFYNQNHIGADQDNNTSGITNGSITLITQFWPLFFKKIFPKFLQLAQAMPDEKFIIKVAPREPMQKYENALSNVFIPTDNSLEEILRQSKIVIGLNSTALLESMQMGIPTLVVDLFFESENPMALTCLKINSEWVNDIKKILNNKSERVQIIHRQQKLLSYMVRQESGSAMRIANLVKSMEYSE